MTNATLEPTTLQSSATTEAPTKLVEVVPLPAAPDTDTGRISPDGRAQRKITQSTPIQGKKQGPLSRPVYPLRDALFQLGLARPGKRWYRETQILNAKDKAVLDIALHGFL